jgi:hypothetical protein
MTNAGTPLVVLCYENESQNQSRPGKPGRQRGCAPKAASSQRENKNEKENKMKKLKWMLILTLFMACVLAPGCAKNSEEAVIDVTDVCSTELGSGTTQICAPSKGLARHYRIEGVQTTMSHTSVTLYTGYFSPPSGGQAPTAGGQSRTAFYHGNGMSPPPSTTVNYGNQNVTVSPPFTAFTTAPQEVCMDISDATPPRITLWATGVNSADCKDRTTLTAASSLFNKNDWTSVTAANNAAAYLYKGAGTSATKVTAYATTLGTGF